MKFVTSIILAVALMGAVLIVPSTASAINGSDVNCYEHADDPPQPSSLSLKVNEHSLTGQVQLRGLVRPIQELGTDPQVVSAIQRYCQQRAQLFLDVTRQGKRIARFVITAKSSLSTGRLNKRQTFRKQIHPIGNERFCVRLHGFVRDPDQVVARIDSGQLCGSTKREQRTIRIR